MGGEGCPSMDVTDAEQVEEMAEIAGVFLTDLGAERVLVVHGDEDHAAPVTQVFSGLSYEGIESLLFEWGGVAETSETAFVTERYDRHVVLAPLRDSSGDCLGMLYGDSRSPFPADAVESLSTFANHYLNLLLEICVLRAGAMAAPPPAAAVPQEQPPDPVIQMYLPAEEPQIEKAAPVSPGPRIRLKPEEPLVPPGSRPSLASRRLALKAATQPKALLPTAESKKRPVPLGAPIDLPKPDEDDDGPVLHALPDLQEYVILDWYR